MRCHRQLHQNIRPGEQVRRVTAIQPAGNANPCDVLRSIVDELKPERSDTSKVKEPVCVSIAWSADGQTLFGGFTDDLVRVWNVTS